MGRQQPSAGSSAFVSLLFSAVIIGALQYYQDLFDQTIATRVIGGIIGSLLYLTLVVLVSSSGELLGGKGGSGWITVLFCTAAAAFAASAVCETSAAISVAASIPMTVYLQSASNFIHQR